jgi:hypothetical protein
LLVVEVERVMLEIVELEILIKQEVLVVVALVKMEDL